MADFYPPCPVDRSHGPLDLLDTDWDRPDPAQNLATSKAGIDRIAKGRQRLRLPATVEMRLACASCNAEVRILWPAVIEVLTPGAPRTRPRREAVR